MKHEILLIQSFILKERQERYLNLISTKKGRIKFCSYIAHFNDLNPEYCKINRVEIDVLELYNLLKTKGFADACYIISEHSKYDQQELQLANALHLLFNSGISYFLSCLSGKIAYYEGEERNRKFLLVR